MVTQFFRHLYQTLYRWINIPQNSPEMDRTNFRNVQIDAVGVALGTAIAPFLPVLLTRLNANTFQVSMLTFMPAIAGLILAIPLGQFLQTRKNIVPWFSAARLAVLSSYGLTGILLIIFPQTGAILGILGLWAIATIPQTVLNITFSVVMNKVSGPTGRYELMSHRWSLMGFTNAIAALIAGELLETWEFPRNYQLVFIIFSIGGLISYYFSSRINIPDNIVTYETVKHSIKDRVKGYIHLIFSEKPFVSFVAKRFLFLSGAALANPLLPIYYVKNLGSSDFWIALINIAASTTVIFGYFLWMNQTRHRGSHMVLVAATFGGSLYPILTGISQQVWPVVIFAGLNGIFQAGINLVFFDELMNRVPPDQSATFVAAAQMTQYLSLIAAPLFAPWISDTLGIRAGLVIAGSLSLLGFFSFFMEKKWGKR
jgi:MFS family permease